MRPRALARAPWPPRRYGWIAHYEDGERLHEIYDAPPLSRFEDVDLARLARFALVDLWPGGEGNVIGIDCETGVFTVRGRQVAFALGDVMLTGRRASYRNVIHYKSAHVDHRPGVGSSGTVVDAHHVGHRCELADLSFQVVLRLDVATRRIGIAANVRAKEEPAAGAFRVLVDGQPIGSEAAFDAALALDRRRDLHAGVEVP